MPALMLPRNAVGKSIVSCRHSSTRSSLRMPRPTSTFANRSTRSASSPYVYEPPSSTNASLPARLASRLRSIRSCAALYSAGNVSSGGSRSWSAWLRASIASRLRELDRAAGQQVQDQRLASRYRRNVCAVRSVDPPSCAAPIENGVAIERHDKVDFTVGMAVMRPGDVLHFDDVDGE